VAQKKIPKPAWYKNTYFWIAGILFILCIVGLIGGDHTIRDPGPGQRRESGLVFIYFGGSLLMLVNGWLSHRQTVQHYHEALEGEEN